MDPTSANQYQNLHYTFQNLALSPPPPPPSEMPALPQNGANGPANGQEAVYYEEYAGNGQQPTHQGHQQQQQQQGHQQYYEQQQQPGQGGQQQRAGPEGPADMRSVGRNGWGSTAGANANGGTAGAMSNASRGKGQRSGLPSVRPLQSLQAHPLIRGAGVRHQAKCRGQKGRGQPGDWSSAQPLVITAGSRPCPVVEVDALQA
jgi:ABC-type nickel/cobalt efflux system permease component RcnA